ncbi:YopX family protein [Ornithinibacillus bavariensis]|uniref:YopX family protein n=1 Tax=Ornithinibacillus bavariensis TaxID=545502 RepID=UPI000ECB1FB6|nr:hypothetical protein [Ornithinibacillus sp.]
MREVKFRARLDKQSFPNSYNKGWVYGFVSKYEGDWCIDTYGNDGSFVRDNQFLQIDGETIGQYTGLDDKKGKELFFNDVINIYLEKKKFGEYVFKNSLVSKLGHLVSLYNLIHDNGASFEIIGNRFENPELLEGSTCNS